MGVHNRSSRKALCAINSDFVIAKTCSKSGDPPPNLCSGGLYCYPRQTVDPAGELPPIHNNASPRPFSLPLDRRRPEKCSVYRCLVNKAAYMIVFYSWSCLRGAAIMSLFTGSCIAIRTSSIHAAARQRRAPCTTWALSKVLLNASRPGDGGGSKQELGICGTRKQ